MVIVKGCEGGAKPSDELKAAMKNYNDELTKAGVFVAIEGLYSAAQGARVKFNGKDRIVTDGPFTEAKELIGGFWLWKCASKEAALAWLKKAPFDGGMEVELRQVFEPEDLGVALMPELRTQDERLRAQIAQKQ